MANDEVEVVVEDNDELVFEDRIAARTFAYTRLLAQVSQLQDPALQKEGLMMLSRLRRTFKANSDADVAVIGGGKEE